MPQGAPFAQRGARAFKETATRRGNSSSGLDFANAVAYDSGGYTATSVAVADVNGDGKPDLLVANYCAVTAIVRTAMARWACCWVTVTVHSKQR